VEADGTLGGVNIAEIAQVVGSVPALWIVSGGVGRREDLEALAGLSELHGVIVGRALYEGRVTLQECLSLATPS
jgi:phosphoribosylformimino-5-aminoimidazole carboxamide ribotide isomerase